MPRNCKTIRSRFAVFVSCFCIVNSTYSQCISAGTKNPFTSGSVSLPGAALSFSPTSFSLVSDNNRSSADALVALFDGVTDYLQVTNFGFSIPATATVCGIQVDVEKRAQNIGIITFLESYVTDNMAKIVKNGTILNTVNRATSAHWGSSDVVISYGGPNDLWGTSWFPVDINSAGFGFAFSAKLHGLLSLFPSAQVDDIQITVYYLPGGILPMGISDFNVSGMAGNKAAISWKAALSNSPSQFVLQRSPDGIHWEPVKGNITEIKSHTDAQFYTADNSPYPGKSFYRLQIRSTSGAVSYSENRSITIEAEVGVRAYPNPFTNFILVTGADKSKKLLLYNEYGQKIAIPEQITGNTTRLQLNTLEKGIYFLVTGDKKIKIIKQ